MISPTQPNQPKPKGPGFDPYTQPWVPASDHIGSVPHEVFRPEFLRQTFAKPWDLQLDLPAETRIRYQERASATHSDARLTQSWIPAAVLVPFVMHDSGVTVLLTQRTAHLHDHAGQVSFPGGRIEQTDASPYAAAIRETVEETGLPAHHIDILGELPEYRTGTGFTITPVAAMVQPGFSLSPDTFEVAHVFEVPLSFLTHPQNYRLHTAQFPDGSIRQYYSVVWQDFFIWGATAAMLRSTYQILAASFAATNR